MAMTSSRAPVATFYTVRDGYDALHVRWNGADEEEAKMALPKVTIKDSSSSPLCSCSSCEIVVDLRSYVLFRRGRN